MATETPSTGLVVLSPLGKLDAGAWSYAERPARLAGKRIGLVENGKDNSDRLLTALGEVLNDQYGLAAVRMWHKSSPARGVSPEQMDEMKLAGIDFVVAGIGDCGSCSSGSVLDGLLLEENGLPAAVIWTRPFAPTGQARAAARGVPDYEFALSGHPISNKTPAQLRGMAQAVAEHVVQLLLRSRAGD